MDFNYYMKLKGMVLSDITEKIVQDYSDFVSFKEKQFPNSSYEEAYSKWSTLLDSVSKPEATNQNNETKVIPIEEHTELTSFNNEVAELFTNLLDCENTLPDATPSLQLTLDDTTPTMINSQQPKGKNMVALKRVYEEEEEEKKNPKRKKIGGRPSKLQSTISRIPTMNYDMDKLYDVSTFKLKLLNTSGELLKEKQIAFYRDIITSCPRDFELVDFMMEKHKNILFKIRADISEANNIIDIINRFSS